MAESTASDRETRQRILEAAARLFAERGFKNVTVRDICREADANVSGVNYHFRDKLNLYREVVRKVAERMSCDKENALRSGEGGTPEQRLRAYIRGSLHRLLSREKESWMDKLIGREMIDPTPALDLIIEHGIKPNSQRLAALVAELLNCPPDDERVWQCAVSIQAQCLFYKNSKPVFERWEPTFRFTPEFIARVAEHIAEFSLAGIRATAERRAGVTP